MITEEQLAAAILARFEAEGWDVYSEVMLLRELDDQRYPVGTGRADLVAVRGDELCVVECKLDLSFDLFAQGARWRPYANMVCLGVVAAKPTAGRREAFIVARDYYGMGVLEVGDEGVDFRAAPRVRRNVSDALRGSLRPEHKTHARAGTNKGGQFTGYKATCEALARYVAEHPCCTLGEAVSSIKHHYRTDDAALNELGKAIRKGTIPNVYAGWRQRLWPTEVQARKGGSE